MHCCWLHNPQWINTRHLPMLRFDEAFDNAWYLMHMMQFSFAISHCYISLHFWVFQLSQGSVATLITWSGWNSYSYVSFISKSTVKMVFLTKLQTKISWLLWLALYSYDQVTICEISGAGVWSCGRRLGRWMTTPGAFLEGIYSQGRDFSSQGWTLTTPPPVKQNPGYGRLWH